ncbi:MAG TPA: NAD(P)-binding domain-containing protein [Vicinamibacterales bacterium]|nr:NAD(P)-binding domain-containing protein [Vicinamibacterales bacterium]
MKVGVVGSGQVGQALGHGFASLGYDVRIGSRDPGKLRGWVDQHGRHAGAGTFDEVAEFGELMVIATSWSGTANALQLAGPRQFAGKVVIDATNPLDSTSSAPRLAISGQDSGGEQVQRWLGDARVVKAFNTVGHAQMFRPEFPAGPPDMFIAGDDAGAKRTVTGLLKDFGWGIVDAGSIEASRYLEALAMLWIAYAARTRSTNAAFKLLRK